MSSERILIIDDSQDNLRLTQMLLECEGFQVSTAGDANQALLVLQTEQPDLILMDIQLPGMDGLELTRCLRKIPAFQNSPIVALTAYAMPGDEAHALEAGCNGYITKPIDTRAFGGLIRGYLEGRRCSASCLPSAEVGPSP